MFEQAFKRIDDILRKDAGLSTEIDYIAQTSWLLFLKYLDALEEDRAARALLDGTPHAFLLDEPYRWHCWAAPLTADGAPDHDRARVGDDLRDFVNGELFPYLKGFKQRASRPDTIEYKIGEIFGELENRLQSGYNLREVIELVDTLRFNSQREKHELSELYEAKIRKMGNAGRNGGEYFTPRPLIRAMLAVVEPRVGETVYDGALGSAGFLCEAFARMLPSANTVASRSRLQTGTFYGQEKKPLPYVIGLMNMILHGLDAPNIVHTNTLEENLNNIE